MMTIKNNDNYNIAKNGYDNNEYSITRKYLPKVFNSLKEYKTSRFLYHGVTPKIGNEKDEIGLPSQFLKSCEYIKLIKKIQMEGVIGHAGKHPISHNDDFPPIFVSTNISNTHSYIGFGFDYKVHKFPVFKEAGMNSEVVIFTKNLKPDFLYIKSWQYIQIHGYDSDRSSLENLSERELKALKIHIHKSRDKMVEDNIDFQIVCPDGELIDHDEYEEIVGEF
jgi:hypothetical protein